MIETLLDSALRSIALAAIDASAVNSTAATQTRSIWNGRTDRATCSR